MEELTTTHQIAKRCSTIIDATKLALQTSLEKS
jgi:hypothetical protein